MGFQSRLWVVPVWLGRPSRTTWTCHTCRCPNTCLWHHRRNPMIWRSWSSLPKHSNKDASNWASLRYLRGKLQFEDIKKVPNYWKQYRVVQWPSLDGILTAWFFSLCSSFFQSQKVSNLVNWSLCITFIHEYLNCSFFIFVSVFCDGLVTGPNVLTLYLHCKNRKSCQIFLV